MIGSPGKRQYRDRLGAMSLRGVLGSVWTLAFALVAVILWKSLPAWHASTFLGSAWQPSAGQFGLVPFLVGSLLVTGAALAISAPLCLMAALYLSEYASKRLRDRIRPMLDVLAGIPSVVFGLFGVTLIVPAVRTLGLACGVATSGYSLLAGALVLALMATPFIVAVALEVFLAVPREAREAALSLGATPWETIRHVVLPHGRSGVVAALVLGFARAFGETLAVLMVVGNVARVPHSPLDPAYPLPALLANAYGEMMSIPHMDAVLMTAALMLLCVTGGVSLIATLILRRLRKGAAC